jgi:hypothetical protein
VDQAHEQIPNLGAVLVFVEQCIIAMENDFLERPFAKIIIEWSSRLAQEQRQLGKGGLTH